MTDLRLLQITDSAFPLGGFAFSSGLESAAKLGLIADLAAFRKYLRNYLHQTAHSEIPFLKSAFELTGAGYQDLEPLYKRFNAFVTIPTMRQASVTQGRSILLVFRAAYPDVRVNDFTNWLQERKLTPHFVPTFGVCTKLAGLPIKDALFGYCYMALRDQISAAVRLGLLGPQEGQRVLWKLIDEAPEVLSAAENLSYDQAVRTCVSLDIAQASHSRLYSRMFRS